MDAILLVAMVLVNLTLGFIILSRDSSRLHSWLFFVMSVVISLWITANFFTNHYFGSTLLVDVSNRLAFLFGYGIVASGMAFTYFFPVVRKVNKYELSTLIALITITLGLSVTDLVAGNTEVLDKGIHFTPGPLVILFLISFVALVLTIARNLIRLPGGVTIKTRQQARIVLLAFVFSALAGLTLNLGLPLAGATWQVTRLGPLSTVVLVSLTAYAIVRHGLFDIKTAVIRTAGYVLTLATLSLVYFLMAYLTSITIFKENLTTGFSMSPVNIGLALVLAFIFQPIKSFFDKTTDKIFLKEKYDTSEFIARLGNVLTSTTDLRTLLKEAAIEIGTTLKSEQAFFYATYSGDRHISAGTKDHTVFSSEEFEAIGQYALSHSPGVIVTDFVASDGDLVHHILKRRSIALLMPIMRGKLIFGYLALGEQLSSGYKERDIKVLETVAGELLIAIQNSLSAQEVRDTNIHLQERIKDATDELTRSNAELKKLDKSKDEFLSLASHQLRTPLTSVKGYLSMVLDEDMGKVTPDQDKALRQAYDSAQRMVFLINDFLNVSRLQTGRFELETHAVDIVTMTSEEVSQLTDTAAGKHITLSYTQPAPIEGFFADENKLRQVMMNFIDNAIYYSLPETTVEVTLYEDKGHVIFKVVDNGIGVPESEQAKLFTKFFRATNARRQRPDGTGIGLYMAKKVIIAHGGEMIFESAEGKGSVFGFTLPIQGVPTPGSAE